MTIIRGWSEEECSILRDNYGKIKIQQLELLLPHKNRCAIQKYAQKLHLQGNQSIAQRIHTYNENYFDYPTIENCYWAGFIAADGCFIKDGGVQIALAYKDIEILQNFVKHTKYSGPIRDFILEDKKYCKVIYWGAYSWQDNLKQIWNITSIKSNTLQPPNLQLLEHIYAYIIGYFDGDGTMCFTKNYKKYRFVFGFCGTQRVMEWIKYYIDNLIGYETKAGIHKNGISQYNKAMKWSGKNAINIHKTLSSIINIDWKLKRKWCIQYEKK